MKTMKTTKILFGFALLLITSGCIKDSITTNNFSEDEAKVNAKLDIANDDISDIVELQFNATMENNQNGRGFENNPVVMDFPACATVTRVPAFGTLITPGTLVTKTIDFGTTGCTLQNGNVLKGKIIISFLYNPNATSHTINYEFVAFYHNAIRFDGNKNFTRTMSQATGSSPSHPIVVMNMEFTATFPDGRVFTRIGSRTREIISGYNTPNILLDNIYEVTGAWSTSFPNTTVQYSTITTPLIVKLSCISTNKPLLVQGVITFQRNGNIATLDYGSGDCDNLAVFTINGISYNIIIGN